MTHKFLFVVCGPTAVGKTALAIWIAKNFETEIISADARQFYKEMNIGTAKPNENELNSVPHHFINSLSVEQDYSAGDFEKEAIPVLEKIFSKKNSAVLVGGSGLFIKAVCEGLDEFPVVNQQIRDELRKEFEAKGISFLQEKLKELDAEYFAIVDKENHRRLIRALEVCLSTGKTFSEFHKHEKKERNFQIIKIGLNLPREKLYERINLRVDEMIKSGLVEEAEKLFPLRKLNALQTVGYVELFDYFEKKISLNEAIEKIKQHTRNYAKRQLTWFNQDKTIHWFLPNEDEKIISFLQSQISHE